MKNKYDSSVVFLYASHNEHLLPDEFRKKIPYTTISHWRKMEYEDYLGSEFRHLFTDVTKAAIVRKENEKLKRTLGGIKRSWITLSPYMMNVIRKADKDKLLQKKIVECIFVLSKPMGLDGALKLFGLSRTLYYQWLLEARTDCWDSYLSLCVKRHPHQLQLKEFKTIEKMLKDPELGHWPIASIASQSYRNGKVIASLHTWYKCARLLEINKKTVRKIQKHKGLNASCSNEFLHCDTTYYPMNDEEVKSITFVMDSYSKMILGYHISVKATFENVKTALIKALNVMAMHPDQEFRHPEEHHSYLVTDGGSENNNKKLNDFISRLTEYKITKIRALKDIRFSNSPVEAIHKTIKGRYLRNRKFETLEGFERFIVWAVEDYNEKRPHFKHKPLTPKEVYFGHKLQLDHEKRMQNAKKTRVRNNKCSKCNRCQCIESKIAC
ncbi:MAG TPA: integrase core domain-containing protein [Bacteroidia bacterium]|jgi:transposase InsO family protein|nr:integrase core domain-containing protein [Bacteroidia bacterium]